MRKGICELADRVSLVWKSSLLILLIVAPFVVNAQSGFTSNFDHFTTGFPLEGAHRTVSCESCHVSGVFKGTPRQCATCHSRGGFVKATPLPLNHILSTAQCQDCHTESTWAPVRMVDHTQVIGSCSSCHDGLKASGKPASNHPITTQQCDVCHRSTGWIPTFFNHQDVMGNCVGCHNGVEATGKGTGHINTTNICEDCHNTSRWDPVIRVDHSQVLGSCSSCHDGIIATGKDQNHIATNMLCDDCHTTNAWVPAVFDHASVQAGTCTSCHNGTIATGKDQGHVQTNAQCDDCHTTNAWIPANFDHAGVMGSCSTCHNGIQATGKGNGHFITPLECDYCHETDFWTPLNFMHASPGYPGDHRNPLACTDCHGGNSATVTWPFPAYQPDCAACHAGDYKEGPHKKTENPDTKYMVAELRDCSGACHVYTDSSLTTISNSRPGPEHRVNDGGF